MEKEKTISDSRKLLRMDGVSSSNAEGLGDSDSAYSDAYDYDDEEEEAYAPIMHPALDKALEDFMDMLDRYQEIFAYEDAISNELRKQVDPGVLLEKMVIANNAGDDMLAVEAQIKGYAKTFSNALDTINGMLENEAPDGSVWEKKLELFSNIVKKIDSETLDFGYNTYEFALKSIYIDFMKIIKEKRMGGEIFDYFMFSDMDTELRAKTLREIMESEEMN